MKKYDVLCIGTALIDSIIRGFDPVPVSASGYRAESSSLNVGGEAVNVSMAAAKLGLKAGILCCVGNDAAGDLIEASLKKCGVDTELLIRSEERQTPVTTMFVGPDGSRQSVTNSSHRYNFHPERCASVFGTAKVLCLGSLFRTPFDEPEAVFTLVKDAKEAGCIVAADTKLPNRKQLLLEDYREALPFIDYITPNEDEAEYCSGKQDPAEMADVFLEKGVRNVILKLGGKGCFFKNREESFSLPAFEIEAADATGAGDNFLAGFLSELLKGKSTYEALRFANACGAVCTGAVGAGTALKNREQILSFLAAQKERQDQKGGRDGI